MQNKHGGLIRSHDRHRKRCVPNSLTQCGFYVMESTVSSNYTRNIHRPSTPEKEVNRKENTVNKIAKGRQIRKSTHAQIPILAKVLFHYVMFCDKENRDLSSKVYRVSFSRIS